MKRENRVIVLNPDRLARQIFPPFKFLLEALLARDVEVFCVSFLSFSLSRSYPKLHLKLGKNNRGLFYYPRFLSLSLLEVFKNCFLETAHAIVVFRCADVIWHRFSALASRTPIVFFVDYVPWSHLGPLKLRWRYFLLQPRLFFRILGFYGANKIVFSSQTLCDQICENLPFIKSKSVVVHYSSDIFEQLEKSERKKSREKIERGFSAVDRPYLIASTAGYHSGFAIEVCLRALVANEDTSTVLLLHTDHPDLNYFSSLIIGLGLSDRVELYDGEQNFFQLISSCDLLILPTAGAGTGGFALSALAQNIPVLGVDTPDLREWLSEEELLFETGNVGQLSNRLLAVKRGDEAYSHAFSAARERAREFGSDWAGRALVEILEPF